MVPLSDWFLTIEERGNPDTAIDRRRGSSWSEGNNCRVLVHGATYFAQLFDELDGLEEGDSVFFTDWRGDADELLAGAIVTIRDGQRVCRRLPLP